MVEGVRVILVGVRVAVGEVGVVMGSRSSDGRSRGAGGEE